MLYQLFFFSRTDHEPGGRKQFSEPGWSHRDGRVKLKVVLCEKLGTQNTHVAIMENIMGVVGFIQNMLVWVNKSSHNVLYIYINCTPIQHTWQCSQWYENTEWTNPANGNCSSNELGWACASIYRGSGQHLGCILTYSHITPNTCWCEWTKLCYSSTTQAM